jgi:hypothetical protein
MVSVQADCTLDAALALLRSTARATDATVEHIAGEVVHRHVRFEEQRSGATSPVRRHRS